MAPPQARQKNNKLVEVAKDGFALLDEFYSRDPMKSQACDHDHDHNHHQGNHHNQQSIYWGPQVVKKSVINSNQTAQFYGDGEIVDHHHH